MNQAVDPQDYNEVLIRLKASVYNALLRARPDLLNQAEGVTPINHVLSPTELQRLEDMLVGGAEIVDDKKLEDILPSAILEIEAAADTFDKAAALERATTEKMTLRLASIENSTARMQAALARSRKSLGKPL